MDNLRNKVVFLLGAAISSVLLFSCAQDKSREALSLDSFSRSPKETTLAFIEAQKGTKICMQTQGFEYDIAANTPITKVAGINPESTLDERKQAGFGFVDFMLPPQVRPPEDTATRNLGVQELKTYNDNLVKCNTVAFAKEKVVGDLSTEYEERRNVFRDRIEADPKIKALWKQYGTCLSGKGWRFTGNQQQFAVLIFQKVEKSNPPGKMRAEEIRAAIDEFHCYAAVKTAKQKLEAPIWASFISQNKEFLSNYNEKLHEVAKAKGLDE